MSSYLENVSSLVIPVYSRRVPSYFLTRPNPTKFGPPTVEDYLSDSGRSTPRLFDVKVEELIPYQTCVGVSG